jgi:hypothetical protein
MLMTTFVFGIVLGAGLFTGASAMLAVSMAAEVAFRAWRHRRGGADAA